ncbi:hypothetical protein BpHYR1_033867 [Brachionus plicatilis]|uniref:Uncharacterized protein n=1 Tax=Brachionus plicatilis TaxID=10195 RepID=A0A3M7RUV0_BRAPC|nr:hypothetical protein BpHYR1_033867 [Brachionus plicatilis]
MDLNILKIDSFKAILHQFNTIDQLMFALKIGKQINEISIDDLINSRINFNYSEYEFAYEGLECLICN